MNNVLVINSGSSGISSAHSTNPEASSQTLHKHTQHFAHVIYSLCGHRRTAAVLSQTAAERFQHPCSQSGGRGAEDTQCEFR